MSRAKRRNAVRRATLRRGFLLCSLLVACDQRVLADEVVEQQFLSSRTDESLEEVLYYAVGVELAQQGFSTTRKSGGPYVLRTSYEHQHSGVLLTFTLRDITETQVLAEAEAAGPLDDSLDAWVGAAVKGFVSQLRVRAGSNLESRIDGVFRKTVPRASPPPSGPPPSYATTLALPAPRLPQEAKSPPRRPNLYVGLGLGGTAFLGPLSDYAHYGLGATWKAGCLWLRDSRSVQLGPRFSATKVFNDSGVTGGPLDLTAASLGADWGTGSQQPYRLSWGVGLGVMVITVEGSNPVSKAVPWADAGGSAEFPVGGGFFLGGEVRLQAAVESFLIWGLTPAFSVRKEF